MDAAVTMAAEAEAAAAEEEEEEEEVEEEEAAAAEAEAIGVILQRSAQKRSGSSTRSQGTMLTEEACDL